MPPYALPFTLYFIVLPSFYHHLSQSPSPKVLPPLFLRPFSHSSFQSFLFALFFLILSQFLKFTFSLPPFSYMPPLSFPSSSPFSVSLCHFPQSHTSSIFSILSSSLLISLYNPIFLSHSSQISSLLFRFPFVLQLCLFLSHFPPFYFSIAPSHSLAFHYPLSPHLALFHSFLFSTFHSSPSACHVPFLPFSQCRAPVFSLSL